MNEGITADERLTIGFDLGDKFSEACVLGAAGEVVESFRVRTTQPALERALVRFASARVVREVGTNSPDRFDAEPLARLGRVDPALLSPIVHRGEQAQRDLV